MHRRDFLKQAFCTSLTSRLLLPGSLAGLAALVSQPAQAAAFQRQVVQITLDGGPDLRHLFVPEPDSPFGKTFWENHATAQGIRTPSETHINQRWQEAYEPIEFDGQVFGILKKAGWLKDEILAGRVAIVSNVFGSKSRDHVHSLLALDYGRWDTPANDLLGSGWGGRLAAAHPQGRVLSLTSTPRRFCYAPSPQDLNRRSTRDTLLTLTNSREPGLVDYRLTGRNERDMRSLAARGSASYYASLQAERETLPEHLQLLLDHERELRQLAFDLNERLSAQPLPEELEQLRLSRNFHPQITTLYDLLNSIGDLVQMRAASLALGGWDSHKNQQRDIEPLLESLFGVNQGLHQLYRHLNSSAQANTVVLLNGEFGRQIRSNGDWGTDHGEGNYFLVIGEPVRGGIYGEFFPEREIDLLENRRVNTPDIEGRTSLEHLFKPVADWSLGRDSGTQVIRSLQDTQRTPIEAGLDLDRLFTPA